MDARFLLFLSCLCILHFSSQGLVLQRDKSGISVHTSRRLHSHGNRHVLTLSAQDDKEHHDDASANSEKGLLDTKSVPDTSRTNLTDPKAKSGKNETKPSSTPPPSPTESEHMQPAVKKEPQVPNTSSGAEKPDAHQKKDDSAPPDKKSRTPSIQCGDSHCEDRKKAVSACLRSPGDGAHMLSMSITSEADSETVVKVVAPEYLIANPPEVPVSKGKSETIQILIDSSFEVRMLDLEAVKNKNITVISSYGECEIAVPLNFLRSSVLDQKLPFSSYLHRLNPRVVACLVVLLLVVAIVGTWLCYKCCKKKRGGDVKYQHLEMIVPGQSTSKERDEQGTVAWDEDWDDGWEDPEAAKSSSRLSQNLSSRGFGARKHVKDDWDSSWED